MEVPRTETDLVVAARGGDGEAFASLVARYRDRLVMTARGIIGDAHAAEDAAGSTSPAARLPRPKPWMPIRRAGDARDEYGATVAFLLSEDAGYITGTALPVDGGYLAT